MKNAGEFFHEVGLTIFEFLNLIAKSVVAMTAGIAANKQRRLQWVPQQFLERPYLMLPVELAQRKKCIHNTPNGSKQSDIRAD